LSGNFEFDFRRPTITNNEREDHIELL